MQELSQSLSTLLPLSLDPLQFNDPANKEVVEREMTRLASFAHGLSDVKAKPTDDPAMELVSKQFGRDMLEARYLYRQGQRAQSRMLIRNSTSYCISCHTQSDRGPEFLWAPTGEFYSGLSSLDKAAYLFAVRNFEGGLKEFEKAMSSPDIALQPFPALETVTLKALAVAVRVKKDPKLAEQILARIIDSKWAPVYLQLSALQWRRSVKEWQKNPDKVPSLASARQLLMTSWKKMMESPLSRSGMIETLRASAQLHDLLKERKPGKAYAEALYYSGLAAEALRDLELYNMSEFYYESCIRHAPNTEISKNCYLRLESAIISRYGDLDTYTLPPSRREYLNNLTPLALPKGKNWKDQ